MFLGLLRAVVVRRAWQRDERRIEQMKMRKAEEAELKSENVEVVGFAEKAVDASAGLPEGWAANNRQTGKQGGMTQLEVILDAIDYIKTLQEKLNGGRK